MSHSGREIDRMKASEKGAMDDLQFAGKSIWGLAYSIRMGRRENSQRAMSAANRAERRCRKEERISMIPEGRIGTNK